MPVMLRALTILLATSGLCSDASLAQVVRQSVMAEEAADAHGPELPKAPQVVVASDVIPAAAIEAWEILLGVHQSCHSKLCGEHRDCDLAISRFTCHSLQSQHIPLRI